MVNPFLGKSWMSEPTDFDPVEKILNCQSPSIEWHKIHDSVRGNQQFIQIFLKVYKKENFERESAAWATHGLTHPCQFILDEKIS
ncbi:MAG TPA: hypothetical protein VF681_03670 [Abditibacteriaceae bacterium]|jgi:uncharacterized NAD(P)/FAD-binding protein YdhS